MSKVEVDPARLPLLLHDLRLPAISRLWPDIAARSDKEGWPAVRFLSVLAEMEMAERAKRRMDRHLAESRLPPGKTLDSFDFSVVPMISKAFELELRLGSRSTCADAYTLVSSASPGYGPNSTILRI